MLTAPEDLEPAPVDPLIGKVVAGKYRVLERLAHGAMGQIYRAEQIELGRLVALKVLSPELPSTDPTFQRRFVQEAAICARLRHPNTIVIHDHGTYECDGVPTLFIAMELLRGPTLGRVLAAGGALAPVRAVAIAAGVVRALREAHRLGIVHRDLKPANLMLVEDGDGEQVKVVDFGVAKILSGDVDALTLLDRIVGSPRYMAPEQIRGQPVDGRADLYSLGIVLFEMLAGQAPFRTSNPLQTLEAHLTSPLPPIESPTGGTIDPALEVIVRKCCEKDASRRFENADALLEALVAWQDRVADDLLVLPTPEPATPRGVPARTPRSRGRAAALGAVLAATLLAVPIWLGVEVVDAPPPLMEVTVEPGPAPVAMEEAPELALKSVARVRTRAPESAHTLGSPWFNAPLAASPGTVTLRLVSHPAGAEVWEGPTQLGLTPLDVRWGGDRVRVFLLLRDGYAPATVVADRPAEDDRRTVRLWRSRP